MYMQALYWPYFFGYLVIFSVPKDKKVSFIHLGIFIKQLNVE